MTQIEVMKLARRAINNLIASSHLKDPQPWRDARQDSVDALTALNQAIEQAQKFNSTTSMLSTSPPHRQPLMDEMVLLGAKALAKRHADSCGLDFDDVWKYYADEHKDDAKAVLLAAHDITVEHK